jgi:hypothetical protein
MHLRLSGRLRAFARVHQLVPALLFLALTLQPARAGSGEGVPLVLDPVTGPDGNTRVEIRNPRWPGNVWQLRLPEFISVTDVNRNIAARVTPGMNPSTLVIRGIDRASGLSYSFVLSPDERVISIRAVIFNTTEAPLPTEAYVGSCLSFTSAPDFRDPGAIPPRAVFGGDLEPVSVAFGGEGSPLPRSASFLLREAGDYERPDANVTSSLIVKSSADGRRHVGHAWANAWNIGYEINRGVDCVRSNPLVGVVGPRKSHTMVGRIYFLDGDADDVYEAFVGDFPALGYGENIDATTTVVDRGVRIEGKVVDREIRVSVAADSLVEECIVRLHHAQVTNQPIARGDTATVETRKLIANAEFVYTQPDTRYGSVHEFWISEGTRASARVTVKVRDPELWWDRRRVDAETERIRRRFPESVRVRHHGETTHGWPLRSLSAGNPDGAVVVVGGIHGGESGPEIILPVFEALVGDEPELLGKVGLAILPLVNADTRQRLADGYPGYLRKNPNGVDINRNFDAHWYDAQHRYGRPTTDPTSPTYKGKRPESEKETQAVTDFIAEARPLVVVSIHGPGALLLAPNQAKPELMSRCRDVGKRFVESHDPQRGVKGGGVRPDRMPGTLPAWIAVAYDAPAFDQENDQTPECRALSRLHHTRKDLDTLRKRNYSSLRGLLVYFASDSSASE